MRLPYRIAFLSVVPLVAALAAQDEASPVAPTAGDGADLARLTFRIAEPDGREIPGKLTFIGAGGPLAELFTNPAARPADLAVRKNVVYTLSGTGTITVPPGSYAIYASRGLEWSVARTDLSLTAGQEARLDATLVHEVDTTGWVSGDYHLHTVTHSGHGDADLNERIISLVGEGVEFAVATDHDHNTDYGPTIASLGAESALTAVTGNEVTTPIGHFNAFPLDPARPPVPSALYDASEIFRLVRAETNAFGIPAVVQVNHPRWERIDYFTRTGLDPVTGTSTRASWSGDFDSLEVLNENAGWGYYDPLVDRAETGGNSQSVLKDWFHLLNRGQRYAAVGNSDSHTVHYSFAGYPRNFTPSTTDDAGAISAAEVAGAIRSKALFTTLGPFLEVSIGGASLGGEASAVDGRVQVSLRIQAASWIDCDRVRLVANGDVVAELAVEDTRRPLRLERTVELSLERDAWLVTLVEGDESLDPIVFGQERPIPPVAIANPVWIDADGDGRWTSPWERAVETVESLRRAEAGAVSALAALPPCERALVLDALAEAPDHPLADGLIAFGLASEERPCRLSALRAAETAGTRDAVVPALEAAWNAAGARDVFEQAVLVRALFERDVPGTFDRLLAIRERFGATLFQRYAAEVFERLPGKNPEEWLVLGYFDAPRQGVVLETDFGPESDGDPARRYAGRDGTELSWRPRAAAASGYLDLGTLEGPAERGRNALAFAQLWIRAPDARDVPLAFGTDDGSCVYLNGERIYANAARRGAVPLEHFARYPLREGWNRLLFKVENGAGGYGLYCRLFDLECELSTRPE